MHISPADFAQKERRKILVEGPRFSTTVTFARPLNRIEQLLVRALVARVCRNPREEDGDDIPGYFYDAAYASSPIRFSGSAVRIEPGLDFLAHTKLSHELSQVPLIGALVQTSESGWVYDLREVVLPPVTAAELVKQINDSARRQLEEVFPELKTGQEAVSGKGRRRAKLAAQLLLRQRTRRNGISKVGVFVTQHPEQELSLVLLLWNLLKNAEEDRAGLAQQLAEEYRLPLNIPTMGAKTNWYVDQQAVRFSWYLMTEWSNDRDKLARYICNAFAVSNTESVEHLQDIIMRYGSLRWWEERCAPWSALLQMIDADHALLSEERLQRDSQVILGTSVSYSGELSHTPEDCRLRALDHLIRLLSIAIERRNYKVAKLPYGSGNGRRYG